MCVSISRNTFDNDMHIPRLLVILISVAIVGLFVQPCACQLNREALKGRRVILALGGVVKYRCPRNAGLTLELLMNIYDDMAQDVQPEDCPRVKQVFASMKDLIYSCIGSPSVDILQVMGNHVDLVGEYQFNFASVCGPLDQPPTPPPPIRKRRSLEPDFDED